MASIDDWRIDAAANLAPPDGRRVYLTCTGDAGALGQIAFFAPSPVALALNTSYAAALEAESHKQNLEFREVPSPDGPMRLVSSTAISHLYDSMEKSMVAVFFAYQALEAFCNDQLFKSPVDSIRMSDKREERVIDRREAERTLSTSEKLGEVLPVVLNVPTPKGTVIWQDFRSLEDMRDAVVHLKNQTVRHHDQSKEPHQTFVYMIAADARRWPRIAVATIRHFISGTTPDWFVEVSRRVA